MGIKAEMLAEVMRKMAGGASATGALAAGGMASNEAEASFAGLAAKNADKFMVGIARAMESAGKSADEIWQKTGWGRGVDGEWRFEIDDRAMTVDMLDPLPAASHEPRGSVGDVVQHPELYTAYPDLADVRATQTNGRGGSYSDDAGFGQQRIQYGSVEGESIMAHELQHGIQHREGFARGGQPGADDILVEDFDEIDFAELSPIMEKYNLDGDDMGLSPKEFLLQKKSEAIEAGASWHEYMQFDDAYAKAAENARNSGRQLKTGQEKYMALAGETEARNVQTRLNMTTQERRDLAPWHTEDIPRDKQVVRFGSERGNATPGMLGGVAATTAAAMRAAQQKDNKSVIKSPQNPITAKLAMALRDGERAIKGSPAELMYPSGLAPWLERLAYKEKPSKMERAMAIADFL